MKQTRTGLFLLIRVLPAADVSAQVDLSLKLVDMLSEARRLEKRLSDERQSRENKGEAVGDADRVRIDF